MPVRNLFGTGSAYCGFLDTLASIVGNTENVEMSYLKLVNGNPRVLGKTIHHWYQKLNASRPMCQKRHYADEIQHIGKNVGEIGKLQKKNAK